MVNREVLLLSTLLIYRVLLSGGLPLLRCLVFDLDTQSGCSTVTLVPR